MNRNEPYRLVVASHKGGVGCSTLALGLSWQLGALGLRVALSDRRAIPTLAFIAENESGRCEWPGVRLTAPERSVAGDDIEIIDSPPLGECEARPLLVNADGVLLVCVAEILTLKTMEQAIKALRSVRSGESGPKLVGVVLQRYDPKQSSQVAIRERLEAMSSQASVSVIEWDEGIADWPMTPGRGLPQGNGAVGFRELAQRLKAQLASPTVRSEPVTPPKPPAVQAQQPVVQDKQPARTLELETISVSRRRLENAPRSVVPIREPGPLSDRDQRKQGRGIFRKITGLFSKRKL